MDHDLQFAAQDTTRNLNNLEHHRLETMSAIAELTWRCLPLAEKLRSYQGLTVRRVAGDINLGLVAVLCVVCRWPDRKLALRFITGFEVIGCLEPTGVSPPMRREGLLGERCLHEGCSGSHPATHEEL